MDQVPAAPPSAPLPPSAPPPPAAPSPYAAGHPGTAFTAQPMDLARARALSTKFGYIAQGVAWAVFGAGFILAAISRMTEVEGDGKAIFYFILAAVYFGLFGIVGVLAAMIGMRMGVRSAASQVANAGLAMALLMLVAGVWLIFQRASFDENKALAPGIMSLLAGGAGLGAYAMLRLNQPNAWMRAGLLAALAGLLWLITFSMLGSGSLLAGGMSLGDQSTMVCISLAVLVAGLAMAVHGATQGRQRAGVVLLLAAGAALLGTGDLILFFTAVSSLFPSGDGLAGVAAVVISIGLILIGIAGFIVIAAGLTNAAMAARPLMAAQQQRGWAPPNTGAPAWAGPAANATPAWQQPPAYGHAAPAPAAVPAPPAPAYASPAFAEAAPAATLLCPRCRNANPAAATFCASCQLPLRT